MPLLVVMLLFAAPVLLGFAGVLSGATAAQGLAAAALLAIAAILACAARETRAFAGFCRTSCDHSDGSMTELCAPAAHGLGERARAAG